jgi:hypothetical protein
MRKLAAALMIGFLTWSTGFVADSAEAKESKNAAARQNVVKSHAAKGARGLHRQTAKRLVPAKHAQRRPKKVGNTSQALAKRKRVAPTATHKLRPSVISRKHANKPARAISLHKTQLRKTRGQNSARRNASGRTRSRAVTSQDYDTLSSGQPAAHPRRPRTLPSNTRGHRNPTGQHPRTNTGHASSRGMRSDHPFARPASGSVTFEAGAPKPSQWGGQEFPDGTRTDADGRVVEHGPWMSFSKPLARAGDGRVTIETGAPKPNQLGGHDFSDGTSTDSSGRVVQYGPGMSRPYANAGDGMAVHKESMPKPNEFGGFDYPDGTSTDSNNRVVRYGPGTARDRSSGNSGSNSDSSHGSGSSNSGGNNNSSNDSKKDKDKNKDKEKNDSDSGNDPGSDGGTDSSNAEKGDKKKGGGKDKRYGQEGGSNGGYASTVISTVLRGDPRSHNSRQTRNDDDCEGESGRRGGPRGISQPADPTGGRPQTCRPVVIGAASEEEQQQDGDEPLVSAELRSHRRSGPGPIVDPDRFGGTGEPAQRYESISERMQRVVDPW